MKKDTIGDDNSHITAILQWNMQQHSKIFIQHSNIIHAKYAAMKLQQHSIYNVLNGHWKVPAIFKNPF